MPRISAGTKGSGPVALMSLELGGVGKSDGNSCGSDAPPKGEGTWPLHAASGTINASTSAADDARRERCSATVRALVRAPRLLSVSCRYRSEEHTSELL